MLTIRLLGRPSIERDGQQITSPRGRKAWALLCYVLLAERPPSRRRLADLLFADAADPLGAVRWALGELRRALGLTGVLTGDPVVTGFGSDVVVDVELFIKDGKRRTELAGLLDTGGELLDGVALASNLDFESWLLVARHRVSAAVEARLRAAAVGLLAAGRPTEAIPYASRAVSQNPLEQGNHELLVRCLAMAGDQAAALRQVAVCEDIMRRELGIESTEALHEAAAVGPDTAMSPPLSGRAAAISQLEAGRAAVAAGAVEAGLQCLRRAVFEAARCDDDELRARTLVALGGALVHATRGRDEEGAVVLHEAANAAGRAGDRANAVAAYRELAFVEVQAGRRATAETWLAKSREIAETDEEVAGILGVRGMNSSDVGDYPAAIAHLEESIDRARSCGDVRQEAWSLAILGRARLLRGERSQALGLIEQSLGLVRDQRWLAFLPFPQVLRAELDLVVGDHSAAAETLEHAWVLACQVGDACWEGLAARGLGLVHSRRGDDSAAVDWLGQACVRCVRVPDRYQWVHAYVLDASISVALDRDDVDGARSTTAALSALAARCDLREFVVRAHLHRARLGDPRALSSARQLGADIDNPALTALLS